MKKRVVVADDHHMFRQGLISLLTSEDDVEVVGEASDGGRALDLIRSLRPDVAILDISMPGMSGMEVARAVCADSLPTRIVLLTMHTDPGLALEAVASGVEGYLLKASAFEELALALDAVMQNGTFLSPMITGAALRSQRQQGREPEKLSPREKEILKAIAGGLTNRRIGEALCISLKTVETHRTRIMRKLDLHGTAELVAFAIRNGLA